MTMFQKEMDQQPKLKLDDASKILENVFKESNVEPNSVPLEVLTAYSNYRKERFSLQRLVLVIIMVLFFMLPFLFVPSRFEIVKNAEQTEINPTYTLNVTSKMLIKRVTAEINGRNVPVYEVDAHKYSIEPSVNGTMKVTVTLMNHQTSTQYVEVEHVDMQNPTVVSTSTDENYVYLYLSDIGSGIDYETIEAVRMDGQTVQPAFVEEETGCVAFSYPDTTLNVYIQDKAANQLQLVISLHEEPQK